MDEKTATKMIEEIGAWLNAGAKGVERETHETVSADLAREFSRALLEDARADGCSGCLLCQR